MVVFVSLDRGAKGAAVGATVGAIQTTVTQANDANGTLGPAPVPQLSGFGTVGGLVDGISGLITLGTGLAGAMGKGPLRHSDGGKGFAIAHGATVVSSRVVASLLNTPAVTVPGAIARGAALRGARGAYAGGIAPKNATPGVGSTGYSAARFQ